MNILLKSFDGPYCRIITEAALKGRKIVTCISIMNHTREMPELDAERHVWMPAKLLREGQYPDVDWNTITPLDAELIEKMRECEALFLPMLDRYARTGDLPYAERQRQYLEHLRYWSHTLDKEKIGLYLTNHYPHQCYDLVINDLCRLKGIPTRIVDRCFAVDGVFLVDRWQDSAVVLKERYAELQKRYADPAIPVPLSAYYENFYQEEVRRSESPWYTGKREKHLLETSFLRKWTGRALGMLRKKPKQFWASVVSPDFWSRKLGQHHAIAAYDTAVKVPDLTKPYIYAPLHMQPEETTSPRAGAFVHQELIVQLLAACVPPGTFVYVKEHPAQGELCRSEDMYRAMKEFPNVVFVPRDFSTFDLMKHAIAVATATGTAGFEALFRGKPVLMFGDRFYKYAMGVFRIHTAEDCRTALKKIREEGAKPDLRNTRIFLKAIDETSVLYEGGPPNPPSEEVEQRKKRAQGVGEYIHKELAPLFT